MVSHLHAREPARRRRDDGYPPGARETRIEGRTHDAFGQPSDPTGGRPRRATPLSVEHPSALSRREKPARESLGVSFNRGTHPSFATGATTAARALTVLRAAETLAPARKRH